MAGLRQQLVDKCSNREAKCVVVGMGYVGLPLAVELADAGFSTTGLDISKSKVSELSAGRSYVKDVPSDRLPRVAACPDGVADVDDDHIETLGR